MWPVFCFAAFLSFILQISVPSYALHLRNWVWITVNKFICALGLRPPECQIQQQSCCPLQRQGKPYHSSNMWIFRKFGIWKEIYIDLWTARLLFECRYWYDKYRCALCSYLSCIDLLVRIHKFKKKHIIYNTYNDLLRVPFWQHIFQLPQKWSGSGRIRNWCSSGSLVQDCGSVPIRKKYVGI